MTRKSDLFKWWTWFKLFNLRSLLGMALTFYSYMEETREKLAGNYWEKLAGNLFALPPPDILNRVKNKLIDSRLMKIIKKEKYRSHYFIACSEEVTYIITIIILENMFWNINQLFLPTGEKEILLLSLHVCKCSILASVRYLFTYFI